jgi:hypothetical protein
VLPIFNASPAPVDCVSGCGGTGWLTIVGVVLAAGAFVVAVLAWRVSNRQLKIQGIEHKAFLNQINARAVLGVEAGFTDFDAEEQTVDQGVIYRVLAITLRNTGQKAAERASVRVTMPNTLETYWSDPGGGQLPGIDLPVPSPEPIAVAGEQVAAKRLDRTVGPVDLSSDGLTIYVRFRIDVGETHSLTPGTAPPSVLKIAVRVEVTSDDMPADSRVIVLRSYAFTGPVRGA